MRRRLDRRVLLQQARDPAQRHVSLRAGRPTGRRSGGCITRHDFGCSHTSNATTWGSPWGCSASGVASGRTFGLSRGRVSGPDAAGAYMRRPRGRAGRSSPGRGRPRQPAGTRRGCDRPRAMPSRPSLLGHEGRRAGPAHRDRGHGVGATSMRASLTRAASCAGRSRGCAGRARSSPPRPRPASRWCARRGSSPPAPVRVGHLDLPIQSPRPSHGRAEDVRALRGREDAVCWPHGREDAV